MELASIFTWLADKFLQALDLRSSVDVLVHEAHIVNDPIGSPKYFVKVTNLSRKSDVTITHVWVKDESNERDIVNSTRPLPKRLVPSEQWETWFEKSLITDKEGVFKNVKVVLSTGKVCKSERNKDVRPFGNIA